MHQHLVADDVIGRDDGEGNYDLGNDGDTNYVTDELSTNGDINVDENEEDVLEDEEVMSKDVPDIDTVERNAERDVHTDEVIVEEIFGGDKDEGIEVELNASGRPKRKCAGKGVERLKMSINIDNKYTSTKDQNYQFTITSEYHPLSSRRKSCMNVAANYLFTQEAEHAQMSAKAGIKKFGDKVITAMLNEYIQLNIRPVPGKSVLDVSILVQLQMKRSSKFD